MSGGQIIVLDRLGRDVKCYPLPSGFVTLGSSVDCDILVLQPPTVSAHHATIAVHKSQTVVRNVGYGETLVNGESVRVAALRHGDVITMGDRSMRWEYSAPNKRNQGGRSARRASAGGGSAPLRDRALQLAIEMTHRASMPASSEGKQVAIVQPQRRDTNEQTEKPTTSSTVVTSGRRSRPLAHGDAELGPSLDGYSGHSKRTRTSPKPIPHNTTKATLWIESRKTSPRRKVQTPPQVQQPVRRTMSAKKSTPLRLAVLKKAQSAHKPRVVKIEDPLKIDYTKQAAIMLMAKHTPKARLSPNQAKMSPSYVIKKPSPVRKTSARKSRRSGRGSNETGVSSDDVTPKRASTFANDSGRRNRTSVTILEITDASTRSSVATRSSKSPQKSPLLPSPKKSALKDHSKKSTRKTESIQFDLSNLEGHDERNVSEDGQSEYLTLFYSEDEQYPSPRKSINSRSSRMLEKLGTSLTLSPSRKVTPRSPSRKSVRGSMMLQKALENTEADYTGMDHSKNTTAASAFKTRTLESRTRNLESCSVVDLVSLESIDTSKSGDNSVDSTNTTDYATPNATRKTRSTISPTILSSSTPYVAHAHARASRSRSNPNLSKSIVSTISSASTKRFKSLSTPENGHISVNSTRVSRASRSRSRINDSDLLLLDETELEDSSPKTSRRTKTKSNTADDTKADTSTENPVKDGISTPENRHSPVEVGTPVLSIQSLLDSSQTSLYSQKSGKKGRKSVNYSRKTIGVLSEPKRRPLAKSKSVGGISARQTILRLSKDSSEASDRTDVGAPAPDNRDTITPKSAVKIVPEPVKNRHSTAKKPHSKRSMIDDLNESDIVKQLFNSPVKRKLSQSMTEFSRKHLFDEEEETATRSRPARNTIAAPAAGRAPDSPTSDLSESFTPERFVSPLSTPRHSPDLSGIKRLFQKSTPENDLHNVKSVKSLLRTNRTRKSTKNDLTNVTGLKLLFAAPPRNSLSDVRVKEVFRPPPVDDLRRVSGVKSLFRREVSPRNDLTDVRGVKKLFRKSPTNDLRNISGVKRTLRNSPRNDLTDVRGVRKMFRNEKQKEDLHDVSGIEELFDTSSRSLQNSESLFDRWVGKPTVRPVHSKTFSTKLINKPKNRKEKSLHRSLDVVTNNVEEWLQKELDERFKPSSTSRNISHSNRELQKLMTSSVEGGEPLRTSRTRNSSMLKKSASETYSAHMLPIKKRSMMDATADTCIPNLAKLPIKKRAVVHSTPVKGRLHLTMTASEIGRVSPIRAEGNNTQMDADSTYTRTTSHQKVFAEEKSGRPSSVNTPQKTPARAKTPRRTLVTSKASPKTATPMKSSPHKSSPKEASPKRASPAEPAEKTPPIRVTRNRKNTSEKNIKKRRSSLVIGKKTPVMSPKILRSTRARNQLKVETPKWTRGRAVKVTVVVPKPSPKSKPQPEPKTDNTSQTAQASQTGGRQRRTTRKYAVTESQMESQPRRTRAKRNEPKGKENKTDNVLTQKPRAKRGRTAAETEPVPTEPTQKRRLGAKETSVQKVKEVKTRGKSVTKVDSVEEKQPKTRGKKIETQSSVQSEPVTRSRTGKGDDTAALSVTAQPSTKPKGRKRKSPANQEEESPPKIAETEKKRGRLAKQKASVSQDDKTETTNTTPRGRPKKVEEKPAPATGPAVAARGQKAVEPKERPIRVTQKRKTIAEAAVKAKPASARLTRGKIQEAPNKRKPPANQEEESPPKIAETENKRGRLAKQKASVSQDDKTETTNTTPRGKTKKVEEKPAPATGPAVAARGKKAVEPKESPIRFTRKRKTIAEAAVQAKKPAPARLTRGNIQEGAS